MKQFFFLFASFWLATSVWAETAYVTDMLQLNMHATEDLSGAAIRKLRSGDQVEILARSGRVAEVTTIPSGLAMDASDVARNTPNSTKAKSSQYAIRMTMTFFP